MSDRANIFGKIPRQCRWQELKDMTRQLGGEQSLKAEVFELRDGSQLGHCTVKGRTAANQVYSMLPRGEIRALKEWLLIIHSGLLSTWLEWSFCHCFLGDS